jgi:hypothetical protein
MLLLLEDVGDALLEDAGEFSNEEIRDPLLEDVGDALLEDAGEFSNEEIRDPLLEDAGDALLEDAGELSKEDIREGDGLIPFDHIGIGLIYGLGCLIGVSHPGDRRDGL